MKKLTKSAHNKQISGVCGGLAEYFELDQLTSRLIQFKEASALPFLGCAFSKKGVQVALGCAFRYNE